MKPADGHHHSHSHAGFPRSYTFGPNEVSIVGGSGVGALVARLLGELGPDYRVAVVNQSAHGLGRKNEGVWDAVEEGASPVFLAEGERYALIGRGAPDRWTASLLWNDADILLVENERGESIAKVVVVDERGEVLDEIEREAPESVIAYLCTEHLPEEVERRVRTGAHPVFEISDLGALARFLLEFFRRRALSVPLYGLVLGGGRSTRMKRDKAAIAYRGVAQVRYAYELLEGICNRTFVSIRAEQAQEEVFSGLEQIRDRFSEIGPMGGILSAMHTHPEAAWLVLGCDLPFVDDRTLRELEAGRDPILQATCYESTHDALPEPLCAIYEPRYRRRLHQFLAEGRDCPRKALINTRVRRLTLRDRGALDNINSPEDSARAAARIREEAGRAG